MKLEEATKYLARHGFVRDRSTVSKRLKKIGVSARFDIPQGALDKIIKDMEKEAKRRTVSCRPVWKNPLEHNYIQGEGRTDAMFWRCVSYIMEHAGRYGIRIQMEGGAK